MSDSDLRLADHMLLSFRRQRTCHRSRPDRPPGTAGAVRSINCGLYAAANGPLIRSLNQRQSSTSRFHVSTGGGGCEAGSYGCTAMGTTLSVSAQLCVISSGVAMVRLRWERKGNEAAVLPGGAGAIRVT